VLLQYYIYLPKDKSEKLVDEFKSTNNHHKLDTGIVVEEIKARK